MTRLQKTWTLFFAGAFFFAGGCSQKQEAPAKAKTQQVSLSCIGVLPVASSVDQGTGISPADAKSLKEGVRVFDSLLRKQFAGRETAEHAESGVGETHGPMHEGL